MNIFEILDLGRKEREHDCMLEWLCRPEAEHGIADFASAIVEALGREPVQEPVRQVKREFKLSDKSWADLGVEFESALLVVENKVNKSALRAGQLELQHELAGERQRRTGAPLYHCLLCPDGFDVEGFELRSKDFAVLRYGRLAELIESRLERTPEEARVILSQYVSYVRDNVARPASSGVRLATSEEMARRNTSRAAWDETDFMAQAEEKGGRALRSAQAEWLAVLTKMRDVDPRFESAGPANATYRVFLPGTGIDLLWVYADGRIYVRWHAVRSLRGEAAAEEMQAVWKEHVKNFENQDGSYTNAQVGDLPLETLAELLQRTADLAAK